MNDNNQQIITRDFYATDIIARANDDGTPSRIIEGHAIVFDTDSHPWVLNENGDYAVERIASEAITDELLAASDVKLTMYHNAEILLGRCDRGQGTLALERDERGLHFRCELPETDQGERALQAVIRGDIKGCSFKAAVAYADRDCVVSEVTHLDDGRVAYVNTIKRIARLYDVTLTDAPAYPDTDVIARSIGAVTPEPDQTEQTDEAAELAEIERARAAEQSTTTTNNQPTQTNMKKTLTTIVRDLVRTNCKQEFIITRDDSTPSTPPASGNDDDDPDPTILTDNVDAAGLMPIKIQSIIGPLTAGLIWRRLGIPVAHSQSGELVWPVRGTAKTEIVGEGVAVAPQTIDMSKIAMRPERFACSVECTYESLYQSNNAVENIIRTAIAESVEVAINKLVLSTDKVEGSASITGPLVAAKTKASTLKAASLREILKLKAALLKAGVDMSKVAFTMSSATACRLEGTPTDTGSGRFLIENGKMVGIPVETSDVIPDDYIGLGDWSQQAAGFFGDMRMLVNPYAKDTANVVRFTLNFGFGTKTLRPEAFVVAKLPAES